MNLTNKREFFVRTNPKIRIHSHGKRAILPYIRGTMATPVKRSAPARKIPDSAQLEEQIRLRAYELYEARGREHGHDLDDWLQAEGEILGKQRKAAAA